MLEDEVHNERIIATVRMPRSTTLLSISIRPSSRWRVRPAQRESA